MLFRKVQQASGRGVAVLGSLLFLKQLAAKRATRIELRALQGEVNESDLARVDQRRSGQLLQILHNALGLAQHHRAAHGRRLGCGQHVAGGAREKPGASRFANAA